MNQDKYTLLDIVSRDQINRKIAHVFGHTCPTGYRIGRYFFKDPVYIRYDADEYIQSRMIDWLGMQGFNYTLVCSRRGDDLRYNITLRLENQNLIKVMANDRRTAWWRLFKRFVRMIEFNKIKLNKNGKF